MRTNVLIDTLLPQTRQKILVATVLKPKKSWYLRELAEYLKVTPSSLQRELINLSNAGILKKKVSGNRVYFTANQECPIYFELKGLLTKTVGVVGLLQSYLKPLFHRISIAFIYGSIASGMENYESDIDLFIIGEVGLAEVAVCLKEAEAQLSRSINTVIFSVSEAKQKLNQKNHFIEAVRKQEKLILKAEDHELAKVFIRK